MAPSENASRSSLPQPVQTLLLEDMDLLGVVLSWATGEVPSVDGDFSEAESRRNSEVCVDRVCVLLFVMISAIFMRRSDGGGTSVFFLFFLSSYLYEYILNIPASFHPLTIRWLP